MIIGKAEKELQPKHTENRGVTGATTEGFHRRQTQSLSEKPMTGKRNLARPEFDQGNNDKFPKQQEKKGRKADERDPSGLEKPAAEPKREDDQKDGDVSPETGLPTGKTPGTKKQSHNGSIGPENRMSTDEQWHKMFLLLKQHKVKHGSFTIRPEHNVPPVRVSLFCVRHLFKCLREIGD